eukprot:Gb_06311 [translate_table: standard]
MENGAGLECAECESDKAQVVCCTESLAYCNPCSHKIHSKKARSHHIILPIPPCSRCLLHPAILQCFKCSQSPHYSHQKPNPTVLCTHCYISIHSSPSTPIHTVTPLTILANIISNPNWSSITVKQEKNDSEDGYSIKKEKKRKRMDTDDFEPGIKCPSAANNLNMNIKEEPQIFPGNTCKEEITSPPQNQKGTRRNTPRAATRRVFGHIEIHNSSSESDSDGSLSDFEEESGVHRIHRGSISIEAFVVNGDDDDGDEQGGANAATDVHQSVVVGIKERIRKMLELGLHPDTPDIEAQQALKNAQRLLTKHNLQQAEVMKGALKDSNALVGGMRVVELRSKGKIERIGRIEQWVVDLAHVIADNFDTQYFTRKYTKKDRPLQVVFYGIKQNADCAGYAFAATFNRITVMSAKYNPSKNLDDEENEEPTVQSTYTRIARNNYKLGIVAGLREVVNSGQQVEDSEGEQEDGSARGNRKGMRNKSKEKKRRAMQALVVHSKEVGEAFIKEKGINIRISKSRTRESAWNLEAFTRGKIDSKHIDINQKALPTPPTQRKNRPKR